MPVSLDDLETHLFKCADIIRDAVDPTDYKEYILPLVYYKSISDEFEKQYEANVKEYGEEFAVAVALGISRAHTWILARRMSFRGRQIKQRRVYTRV